MSVGVVDFKYSQMFSIQILLVGMRASLSALFTGSKMRQIYANVAVIGKHMSNTIKEKLKKGESEVVEFQDFASKFTVDVSITNPNLGFKFVFLIIRY